MVPKAHDFITVLTPSTRVNCGCLTTAGSGELQALGMNEGYRWKKKLFSATALGCCTGLRKSPLIELSAPLVETSSGHPEIPGQLIDALAGPHALYGHR
jgi:hypothetical protein